MEAKRERLRNEVNEILDRLNTITTGSRSVINPKPGTLEGLDSLIGNVTMIPVLELSNLE